MSCFCSASINSADNSPSNIDEDSVWSTVGPGDTYKFSFEERGITFFSGDLKTHFVVIDEFVFYRETSSQRHSYGETSSNNRKSSRLEASETSFRRSSWSVFSTCTS